MFKDTLKRFGAGHTLSGQKFGRRNKKKFPLDVSIWIRAFERRPSHAGLVTYHPVLITLVSTFRSGRVLHLKRHGICDFLLHNSQHLPARIHEDREESMRHEELVCNMDMFLFNSKKWAQRGSLGFLWGRRAYNYSPGGNWHDAHVASRFPIRFSIMYKSWSGKFFLLLVCFLLKFSISSILNHIGAHSKKNHSIDT